jgi:hypothetical protein
MFGFMKCMAGNCAEASCASASGVCGNAATGGDCAGEVSGIGGGNGGGNSTIDGEGGYREESESGEFCAVKDVGSGGGGDGRAYGGGAVSRNNASTAFRPSRASLVGRHRHGDQNDRQ